MNRETELLQALLRYEPKITIDAMGTPPDILERVISQNAKVAFYLSNVSVSNSYLGGFKIVFNVQYQNTDVSPSDIYVVSSAQEVHSILCRYIGGYKKRLVMFAKNGVNVNAEYNKFTVVNAPFYSNFTGAKIRSGNYSVTPLPFYDFCFDYRIGKVKLEMMENEVNAEIERIARMLFLPTMSDAAKAFLAHNYLAYTIEYTLRENVSNLEKSYMQSAYGALIKRKCVCQGYAEAFKRLMDRAGIKCDIVCGQTAGSSTHHAWNILKLNGERENYHIDVTWDSSWEGISYEYFGLSDSELLGKRTWNREFNVACNSGKNLLLEARREVMRFKAQLIANGVNIKILGY